MANKILKTLTLPNAQGEPVTYELHPEWDNIEGKPKDFGTPDLGSETIIGILPPEHGGTGNANGYIQIGAKDSSTIGDGATAEGYDVIASGEHSHAEGSATVASGLNAHAEGGSTTASGKNAHAEGQQTRAKGEDAHAEGYQTLAEGMNAHAEGYASYAEGYGSHSEGNASHAEGHFSHSEGHESHAAGFSSHAEGYRTHVEGDFAHVEGTGQCITCNITGDANTTVYQVSSLDGLILGACVRLDVRDSGIILYRTAKIININTDNSTITVDKTLDATTSLLNTKVQVCVSGLALSNNTHVEGNKTIAAGRSQHVQGEFNIADPEYDYSNTNSKDTRGKYAHIVGNGSSHANRSNAHTLDWDGNAWYAGSITATKLILGPESYGTSLPETGVEGQIFFLLGGSSGTATDDGNGIITLS